MSINHAIIIGRLGADPELKKTQRGLSVCSFSLAVDRPKTKGQETPITDWISCQAWRQTAEFLCEYARKGSLVAAEGRIQVRGYTNTSGEKKTLTELVCERVQILRQPRQPEAGWSPQQFEPQPAQQQPRQQARSPWPFEQDDDDSTPNVPDLNIDDLPF